MILVSACLAGRPVRYDGTDCLHLKVQQLIHEHKAIAICPELLAGLPTPRLPAEMVGGDGYAVLAGTAQVIDQSGRDVTEQYIQGAYSALAIAQKYQATHVVLKENSPSCGSQQVYDGSFFGIRVDGVGVTTALLRQHGILVLSEKQLSQLAE
ncbi:MULTISPECIES: 2-thiouracil desulfurase family protein [unclassified Acinetobacter]|uniref:DUF523 domain-containing protein n=1 Tax=unclassified Acinetobacter TaxID=196816 RepID=UPI0002CEBB7D|nr:MULTISPECIES: DUF523 domain-containing protein [unclassified Acinetobacter]ENU79631.1 hypothetical protein F975_02883 [Acinetobacter sp. ANC 3789]TCB28546.1 DUF523 domain-containing protein [Acinetobacter sp. ANC 4635]